MVRSVTYVGHLSALWSHEDQYIATIVLVFVGVFLLVGAGVRYSSRTDSRKHKENWDSLCWIMGIFGGLAMAILLFGYSVENTTDDTTIHPTPTPPVPTAQ